jgi:hypothetical protein
MYMKRIMTVALVVLFAVSLTIAQDQSAQKEKSAATTEVKKKAGCCAESKECPDMKDCSEMKGTKGAKMSKQGTKSAKAGVKTAETKAAEVK